MQGYRVIKNDDGQNGGVFPRHDAPPGWIPYFGHEDVGRAIEEVPGLGGRVLKLALTLSVTSFGSFAIHAFSAPSIAGNPDAPTRWMRPVPLSWLNSACRLATTSG